MPPKKDEVVDINKLPPLKKVVCLLLYAANNDVKLQIVDQI